jgi:hypothetical protein
MISRMEVDKMAVSETSYKEALIKIIDELPAEKVSEILDFAAFLKERLITKPLDQYGVIVKTVPPEHYKTLAGIVQWGGDALEDTERLYDIF